MQVWDELASLFQDEAGPGPGSVWWGGKVRGPGGPLCLPGEFAYDVIKETFRDGLGEGAT